VRADETSGPTRRRLITFYVTLGVFVLGVVGGAGIEQATWLFTMWGGGGSELATHEIHMMGHSIIMWAALAAAAMMVRRPAQQIGALWVLALTAGLPLVAVLAYGSLPPEIVPVVAVIIVLAVVVFAAHPAPMRDKFRPTAGASPLLLGLVALAAIPLLAYAVGQLRLQLGGVAGDEHFEFGHYLAMAAYTIGFLLIGGAAALKLRGYRFAGYVAAAYVGWLGLASLVIPRFVESRAASPVSRGWALLAVAWAVVFAITVAMRTRPLEHETPASAPLPAV
jgi:hypothetical protein